MSASPTTASDSSHHPDEPLTDGGHQSWRKVFAPLADDIEDPRVAARLRARQIGSVLNVSPVASAANAINALVVLIIFWRSEHRMVALVWALLVFGVAVRILQVWRRQRKGVERASASQRAISRATVNAAILGLLWAVMPMVLFPAADAGQRLLLATLVTGMICAGGFALSATPMAGTVYVALLGLGSALALLLSREAVAPFVMVMLVMYCLIVVAAVWSTARLFAARFVAEERATQQSEVIGLLLRDFEEHASDLLVETDVQGRMVHVTPRHETLLGQSAAVLSSRSLGEVIRRLVPGDEDSQACLAGIRKCVSTGAPFRELMLPLLRGSETRWWSLTAKPLTGADGSVVGWRGVASDVTDQRRNNERLTWLAHHDTLTGLSNRHHFAMQVSSLLGRGAVGEAELAVLCLDLDHFKGVNDTLGHAAGDALLRALAGRLRENTRTTDVVARIGGDEFAVLMHPVRSDDEALTLTRRLVDGLLAPCEVKGTLISVHTSIGIALAPRDGRDAEALLANADMALFDAKQAGRGEVRVYVPRMAERMRRRVTLEQALRHAVERGEMRLVFQPQVDLVGWRVVGFEALLRWRHPNLGDILPDEFVKVAEDAGLMPALGIWALAEGCRVALSWPEELSVAVNVSPLQAMSRDFAASALAVTQAQGFPTSRLDLEITESSFMNDAPATLSNLQDLRSAGVRVTLDDFGTGFSSLAYLRRFPFDKIKIDRSFVREVLTQRDARAIVRTVITLAQKLDMRCVAEGVASAEQAELFRRYGCDAIQGTLVAGPMEADAVPEFLAAWSGQSTPNWDVDLPTTDRMGL